ncbi:hypothetical protein [Virgibacillus alimentarius]|uniref:hypothetical protein n=1 Tax=Virgibacillus alimentarius TaxID=698769 RepID=UPI000493171D|nr:hypothetical protein [Virgibacillus alimentarius]
MKIVVSFVTVFIISFLLIFKLVYNGNKQEPEGEKIGFFMVIFVTVMLALLPTAAVGLMLFLLLGSANAVNMIFSLNLSVDQLVVLAICFLVYSFIIESIIEIIVKYILGENVFYHSTVLLIRIGVFYVIGKGIGLNPKVSFFIAAGVAIMILLIETLYNWREKNKQKDLKDE